MYDILLRVAYVLGVERVHTGGIMLEYNSCKIVGTHHRFWCHINECDLAVALYYYKAMGVVVYVNISYKLKSGKYRNKLECSYIARGIK